MIDTQNEIGKIINLSHLKVLGALSNENLNKIKVAKKTLITYAHINKVLKKYKELNIIVFEKIGRECKVNFTLKGWQLYHLFESLLLKLKENQEIRK